MSDAYASLDGERVITGLVVTPLRRIWTADVTIASPAAIAERPTLKIGNLTLKAARYRAASYGGSRSVRLVGGAAGWRKSVGPRAYKSPVGLPLALVLQDLASEVGETLQLGSVELIKGHVRTRGPASRVLDALVDSWYVRPDGVTVIGARAATKITTPYTVTSIAGADGRVDVATEDLAAWQPASTFTPPILGAELTISSVIHHIQDGIIRTEALFDGGLAA